MTTWIITGRCGRSRFVDVMLISFWYGNRWPDRIVGGGDMAEQWCKSRDIEWRRTGTVRNPGMVIALDMHDAKLVDAAAQRGIPYVRMADGQQPDQGAGDGKKDSPHVGGGFSAG